MRSVRSRDANTNRDDNDPSRRRNSVEKRLTHPRTHALLPEEERQRMISCKSPRPGQRLPLLLLLLLLLLPPSYRPEESATGCESDI